MKKVVIGVYGKRKKLLTKCETDVSDYLYFCNNTESIFNNENTKDLIQESIDFVENNENCKGCKYSLLCFVNDLDYVISICKITFKRNKVKIRIVDVENAKYKIVEECE